VFELFMVFLTIEVGNILLGLIYLFLMAPALHRHEGSQFCSSEVLWALVFGYLLFVFGCVYGSRVLYYDLKNRYVQLKCNVTEKTNPLWKFISELTSKVTDNIATKLNNRFKLK